MQKRFEGEIGFDYDSSKQDWEPYVPPVAPKGSPNVLFVVWDDTGFGAWDIYGGLVEMPNMRRIQQRGLTYTNFHTTALCSPTRSCLLTGRNPHQNGMAIITEAASGFPGYSGLMPPENGTIAEMLVEQGWNTYAVGKWHLTVPWELGLAANRRTWPLSRGFERFYGFLGAETNQWYPELTADNQTVEAPATPAEGYHLSADLTDKAIRYVADAKQIAPEKPFFLYLAYGATHAPHHVFKEWSDKYKGTFDMGYEQYRVQTLERQKKLGIVPQDTELSPMNPWPIPDVVPEADTILPWQALSEDQKKLFTRMAEVYAGFASYTDDQFGRLLDYLEEAGELDNTLIVVVSDNGASGEGSPNGSVNENKFFNGYPDSLEENMKQLDELGSPATYNHYPTGWAEAFNTPNKMFKRYTLEGGTADPLLIAHPKAMGGGAGGGIRDQYHHAIDIVPTIMDVCGVEQPSTIKGYVQSPIQGVSMRYTFDDAKAASRRTRQYYEMLGSRALYWDGWKVVSRHAPISEKGHYMADEWELYHYDVDRSEAHDLAKQYPDRVAEMVAGWFAIAGANQVFPLDDAGAQRLIRPMPQISKPRDTYVYRAGTTPVPESQAVIRRGKSYTMLADVEITSDKPEGLIYAQGHRFGGDALFIRDGKLRYVYNFLGITEQEFVSSENVTQGKHTYGVRFSKTGVGQYRETLGTTQLLIDDKVVAEGPMKAQSGPFSLTGEGLAVGRDTADPVSRQYEVPFAFTGGNIEQVVFNVSGEEYKDLEKEYAAAMARD